MKKLKYPWNKEMSDYMKSRQEQNLQMAQVNENELMVGRILKKRVGGVWKQQAVWGYRIFDWWNAKIGVAIEVDGPEHRVDYDFYRDEYNFRRSAIIVLRVKNGDLDTLYNHCRIIKKFKTWQERRREIKIGESWRKARKELASRDDFPQVSYLREYLSKFI